VKHLDAAIFTGMRRFEEVIMSEVSLSEAKSAVVSRKWGSAVISGIAGIFAGAAVSGPLLFAIGPFTIFNEAIQSPKVQAVWDELEPLPLMISNPVAFALVLALLGVVHGLVFALIVGGLPGRRLKRGLLYGLIIWLMSHLFFELNGPYGLLGEPMPLVGVELIVSLIGALLEGIVISAVYGRVQI
jgi:hypothetical protein